MGTICRKINKYTQYKNFQKARKMKLDAKLVKKWKIEKGWLLTQKVN